MSEGRCEERRKAAAAARGGGGKRGSKKQPDAMEGTIEGRRDGQDMRGDFDTIIWGAL